MKRKLFTYLILSFGLLFLGSEAAIGAESLSKKLGLRIKTIMIDPWYGGKEKGRLIAQKKYAKNITLEIAKKLQSILETYGFKVYLSREEDENVAPEDRLFRGKSKNADIHIAIKVSRTKKECIKIFVASPPINDNPTLPEKQTLDELKEQLSEILRNLEAESIREDSLSLAGIISKRLKSDTSLTCVELRKGKDYVLENAELPTVMVDFSVSSDEKQGKLAFDEVSIDRIVRSLAKSIKEYSDERAPKEENVI